jgi:hypothetical protein
MSGSAASAVALDGFMFCVFVLNWVLLTEDEALSATPAMVDEFVNKLGGHADNLHCAISDLRDFMRDGDPQWQSWRDCATDYARGHRAGSGQTRERVR